MAITATHHHHTRRGDEMATDVHKSILN